MQVFHMLFYLCRLLICPNIILNQPLYLVCKKENDEPFANVTAYFQGVDGWQAYELIHISQIYGRWYG